MKLFICVFFAYALLSCGVAWLSGYDFNYRSSNVAWGFCTALVASLSLTSITSLITKDFTRKL